MKAIYRGILAYVTDETGYGVVLDGEMYVPYSDLGLVVDPTDAQVAAAKAGDDIPLDDTESSDLADFLREVGTDNPTINEALRLWREERPRQIQRRST